MKKLKSIFMYLGLFLLLIPMEWEALTINDSTEISKNEFEKLVTLFGEDVAIILDNQIVTNLDLSDTGNIISDQKYYRVDEYTINLNQKYLNQVEISKEEYDNEQIKSVSTLLSNRSMEVAKVDSYWIELCMTISQNIGSAIQYVVVTAHYKNIPVQRYQTDVFAMRVEGGHVINGTEFAQNTWLDPWKEGNWHADNYTKSSYLYKGFSNGFGFSLGMPSFSYATDIVEVIAAEISFDNPNSMGVYASLQHPFKYNIGVTESQRYRLSPSGQGEVILFDSSIADNFINLPGIKWTR